jgi:hypothetical protein
LQILMFMGLHVLIYSSKTKLMCAFFGLNVSILAKHFTSANVYDTFLKFTLKVA